MTVLIHTLSQRGRKQILDGGTGGPPLRRKNESRKNPNSLRGNLNGSCPRNMEQFGNGGKKCAHSFEVPITFLELF